MNVPALSLDAFERQAEAFVQARAWREWQFQAGLRPGRGLRSLYTEDFPDFTSRDLYFDLQDATDTDPRRKQGLVGLLAAAHLEGTTVEQAARLGGLQARTTLEFEDRELAWREASARWPLLGEVPRRHELAEAWRAVLRREFNPSLERWHEALRGALAALGAPDWLAFWSEQSGLDAEQSSRLATSLLDLSGDVYGHALSVYFGQLELPIDDAWTADAAWAFRAPRFDAVFSELGRMPVLVRSLRDLGIELEAQTNLRLEPAAAPGVRCIAVQVPDEVHVLSRLIGGYQDYLRSLDGLGQGEHPALTDRSLPFWQRQLGDPTPSLAYGALLAGLVRDRAWLTARLEYTASDDFRVIAHIAWLYRLRRLAALVLYEQRLWQAEPGTALAADFEESLSSALRVRHFGDEYLLGLLDAPWSMLDAARQLRAELFAAHLRLYLQREFDEEWWRSGRAARFLRDELWRVGRRHSADELLGFLGYEGFDPGILWRECADVLAPL